LPDPTITGSVEESQRGRIYSIQEKRHKIRRFKRATVPTNETPQGSTSSERKKKMV